MLVLGCPDPAAAHQAVDPAILALIAPARGPLATTQNTAARRALIEEGRRLFMTETFGGNGRTCGTCHPATNNFTLDPEYIRTLDRRDPLFVAEFNPKLANLEIPQLLRQHALILENVDGFDAPGVLRSVPHTLGLGLSITPDTPGGFPLTHATGWSGDGAPGDGSLRQFAVGGVVQHLPKTLARVPGKDFRLPTGDELEAMLAFQLSLGRSEEMTVDPAMPGALVFKDTTVTAGQALFHDALDRQGAGRTCSGCHGRAGANNAAGRNRNRATGANMVPNIPACLAPGLAPGDGGFGAEPVTMVPANEICGPGADSTIVFRGDQFFNTPSLIEAADTPPFFHNNAAQTIEEAVAFYTSDQFNDSINGNGRAFVLDQDQVDEIGAFLRAINALENVRQAIHYIDNGTGEPGRPSGNTARAALGDTRDAIEVLAEGPMLLLPAAVAALETAQALLGQAMRQDDPALLAEARRELVRARALMIQ